VVTIKLLFPLKPPGKTARPFLLRVVKMPALPLRSVRMRQNSEGRRRTSIEGGNRRMYRGGSGEATVWLHGILSQLGMILSNQEIYGRDYE